MDTKFETIEAAIDDAFEASDSYAMLAIRDFLRERLSPGDIVRLRARLMIPTLPERSRWIHSHFSRMFSAALRSHDWRTPFST